MPNRHSDRNEQGEEDQTEDKDPRPHNYRMHSSPIPLATADAAVSTTFFTTTITHSITPRRLSLLRFHNQSLYKNTQATRLPLLDYCSAS